MRCGNTELAARWPLSGQGTRRWGGRWGLKVKQVSALGAVAAQFPQPQNLVLQNRFSKNQNKEHERPGVAVSGTSHFCKQNKGRFPDFCVPQTFFSPGAVFTRAVCEVQQDNAVLQLKVLEAFLIPGNSVSSENILPSLQQSTTYN